MVMLNSDQGQFFERMNRLGKLKKYAEYKRLKARCAADHSEKGLDE